VKRGVDFKRVNFENLDMAILAEGEEFLLLNDALEKLEKEDPAAAQVVKLRFFAGMTNEEAGRVLGVTDRTAKRYWTFARAWLFRELRAGKRERSERMAGLAAPDHSGPANPKKSA